MKNPNIKTKVVHSKTNPAWNVVGTSLGEKYKIARIPYVVSEVMEVLDQTRDEAFEHAEFISTCFNNSDLIIKNLLNHEKNQCKKLHCFQCEIEMPVKEKNGKIFCSNCGLIHQNL